MEYEMKFCVGCYLPLAMEIAGNLLEQDSHNEELSLRLSPGKAGSFEIMKNGEQVFSKEKSGRLPKSQDLGLNGTGESEPTAIAGNKDSCC